MQPETFIIRLEPKKKLTKIPAQSDSNGILAVQLFSNIA